MKNIIKTCNALVIMLSISLSSTGTVFAQWYDMGTTYPTYDMGTTYPSYDMGTTYPTYDMGTTYPSYDMGTTYPTYDTGTTWPTYSTGTTYPSYDMGTTYPTYDTGTTYPSYDMGTTYPTYDTGTSNYGTVTYGTVDYGTTNYGSWTGYTTTPVTYTNPIYTNPVVTPVTTTYTNPVYTNPITYTTPVYTGGINTVYTCNGVISSTPCTSTVIPVTTTTVCSDGLPPVNGTCNRTTTIPVTTTTVCADGLPPVNGSCNRTNTIPVTTTTICADGQPPANGTCIRTNTIPVTTNTVCSDGLPPVNGTCIRNNTIPTIVNTMCSDGLPPVNGSCVRNITQPTITYPTYSTYQYQNNYQTCWDGSMIPTNSVCPMQFKVCANGTSIPVNQTCYYGNSYVPYTPPITIKFNNVITSVTTEITNTSARCNGIGLIASGAPSTGWFEYGETPNLGRETAHAAIGSAPAAPFSNKLVNLKPVTTYYCRAVMQNQYGVVKGEVVAFTTKSKAVAYVAPVTKTTVKRATTKSTVTKNNTLTCVDGQVVAVNSKSAADLISSGQKLVSLQIEKVSGTLAPGANVIYRLTVKNISDEALKGATVKVTIPQEVTLTNASAGSYDPTMHVLTVPDVPLAAYGDATINWTGTVAPDAQAGKSIVTTGYVNYSVPGSQAQDEVSAYTVGSIVPSADAATTTGAKKVVGVSDTHTSFLPDTLVEWLALIAILFIIFILGRSVYTSYKSEKIEVRH